MARNRTARHGASYICPLCDLECRKRAALAYHYASKHMMKAEIRYHPGDKIHERYLCHCGFYGYNPNEAGEHVLRKHIKKERMTITQLILHGAL